MGTGKESCHEIFFQTAKPRVTIIANKEKVLVLSNLLLITVWLSGRLTARPIEINKAVV